MYLLSQFHSVLLLFLHCSLTISWCAYTTVTSIRCHSKTFNATLARALKFSHVLRKRYGNVLLDPGNKKIIWISEGISLWKLVLFRDIWIVWDGYHFVWMFVLCLCEECIKFFTVFGFSNEISTNFLILRCKCILQNICFLII